MQIEVKNLNFSYGTQPVLQNISFAVPKGAMVAVLGPNGAGKSTLFRCLLRFLRIQSGEILLGGQDINTLSRRAMASLAAYIPQTADPVFNYTVQDMVLMGTTGMLSALRAPKKAQLDAVQQSLQELGIAQLSQRGVCQISGGERQLVLIARAMVQNAQLLLMDEPTANLDYGNQQRVLDQIQSLTRKGYTVLMSTHNPEHALRYASHILALRDGKICAAGETRETLTAALIRQLYGISVTVAEYATPGGTALGILPIEEERE